MFFILFICLAGPENGSSSSLNLSFNRYHIPIKMKRKKLRPAFVQFTIKSDPAFFLTFLNDFLLIVYP